MDWTVRTPPGYVLQSVVESHGWCQLPPFRRVGGDGLSTIITSLGRPPVEITVGSQDGQVTATTASRLPAKTRKSVGSTLRWMLGTEEDLSEFYIAARSDPGLAHVEKLAQGRLLRSASLFEDVVKTILTTNTTWSGTQRMVGRLVEAYGVAVSGLDDRRAFPTADRLAEADVAELRTDQGLGYRAPYIAELAASVASGSLDLDDLKHSDLPTHDLRKRLMEIKGVGPYAAATLLMLLGRYDFLPVDSWAFKLVSHEWYDGEPVGKSEVETAFEHWGEWRALAYWFRDWDLLKEQSE